MDIRFLIHCIVLGSVYLFLSSVGEMHPVWSAGLKQMVLFAHIKLYYGNRERAVFGGAFIIYVLWETVYCITAFVTFPCVWLWKIEPDTFILDIIVMCMHILIYILIVSVIFKKKRKLVRGFSHSARLGIITCCMILEFAILEFRSTVYRFGEIRSYKILLAAMVFSCIVIGLWILNKREEQKKMQELTSYIHKTREIIPSVGRALGRLKELPGQSEQAELLLEELQAICRTDMQEVHREVSVIKTFESTGCLVLDEQLKSYMEEACEGAFQLDIIVRAPVNEILAAGLVDRYQLLQLIGDLYRNACKVVRKRKEGGHILICFGYNGEGFYEISVYDNGMPFPRYVLEHLGERGITTDGTGHGMADIFAVLKKGHGSFALEQTLPENSIFTKGIRIIFDGKEQVEGVL